MMLVQLQATDRVLVEYNPSGEEEGATLMVTFDETHEVYHLIMRNIANEHEVLWRGPFDTVWKKFTDEVDTFETDNHTERLDMSRAQAIMG